MKATKIRVIAYITFGMVTLVGFVYFVGQTRYRISSAVSEYYGAPEYPQDRGSWFSGRF
jgi:hypothetical protein